MRKFVMAAVLTSTVLLPAIAKANFGAEASLGEGAQVSSPQGWERLNLMVTPSYSLPSLLSFIRLQLGIVMDFPVAGKSGRNATNLELRPMIAIVPPILPIYGRVIFAVTNLIERNGEKREIAYGGAVGVRFGLRLVGVFGEVGLLPGSRYFVPSGSTNPTSKYALVVEGRVGVYLQF